MTGETVTRRRKQTACQCATCGKRFEIPDAAARKGRGTYCSRPCFQAARRHAVVSRTEKRCGSCGALKRLEDFSRRKASADGHDRECRPCRSRAKAAAYQGRRSDVRAKQNAWRSANRERVAEWSRKTYQKHHELRRARENAKRRAEPEKWRAYHRASYAKNPDIFRESKKRRRERDPEGFKAVLRAGTRRYELRKRGVPTQHFTAEQVRQRASVFGGCCAYCGGPFEQIDHLKPLALGGPHFLANLRPSCKRCNTRKKATPAKAWLARCRATG